MNSRFDRISALVTGVLATGLWIAGLVIGQGLTDRLPDNASDARVLTWLHANKNLTIVGGWLFMTGCLAFIWFAGVLRSRLADAEGGNHTLSTIGYAGAVAAAVFGIGTQADVGSAINASDVTPATAGMFHHLGDLFFVGAELALIVLMASVAVLAFRVAAVPALVGRVQRTDRDRAVDRADRLGGADLRHAGLDARHGVHARAGTALEALGSFRRSARLVNDPRLAEGPAHRCRLALGVRGVVRLVPERLSGRALGRLEDVAFAGEELDAALREHAVRDAGEERGPSCVAREQGEPDHRDEAVGDHLLVPELERERETVPVPAARLGEIVRPEGEAPEVQERDRLALFVAELRLDRERLGRDRRSSGEVRLLSGDVAEVRERDRKALPLAELAESARRSARAGRPRARGPRPLRRRCRGR